jgi:general secretion pathway protein L
VYFDSRVLGRDDAARTLPVELALVAREPVQAALARLGPLAAGLDAIDAGSPGGRLGYNFLPPEQRRRRVHRMLWINLALAMASLAFLVIAMGQLVDNRIAAVAALQADADAQRDAARAVSTLRASLEDAVAGANFLAVRKASQPSVVELLHALTRTLPDDTFIERLNLTGTTLSLTGQSSQAAQLIERLRQAPGVRDAALSGAIQPDARSGKDRFNISAQVEARRQEAGNAPAPGR